MAALKEENSYIIPQHKIALTSRALVSEDEIRSIFSYLSARDLFLRTSRVNKNWRLVCACEMLQRCFSPSIAMVLFNNSIIKTQQQVVKLRSINEHLGIQKKLNDAAITSIVNLCKAAAPMIYVQQQLVIQQNLQATLQNLTSVTLARDVAQLYPIVDQMNNNTGTPVASVPQHVPHSSSPSISHSPSLSQTSSMANIMNTPAPSTPTKEQQVVAHTIVYIFKDCFLVTDMGFNFLCTQSPMPIAVLKLYGCWRLTDVSINCIHIYSIGGITQIIATPAITKMFGIARMRKFDRQGHV